MNAVKIGNRIFPLWSINWNSFERNGTLEETLSTVGKQVGSIHSCAIDSFLDLVCHTIMPEMDLESGNFNDFMTLLKDNFLVRKEETDRLQAGEMNDYLKARLRVSIKNEDIWNFVSKKYPNDFADGKGNKGRIDASNSHLIEDMIKTNHEKQVIGIKIKRMCKNGHEIFCHLPA